MRPSPTVQTWWTDLKVGLGLLTRLPVGAGTAAGPRDRARATRVAPLVGLIVGLVGGAAFWLADALSLPPLAAALIALTATMILTGAFHEDGLADVADGFGGAFEPARKLAIMREPGIGAYGAVALVLSVGLRAAALAALASPAAATAALIAAHGVGRGLLPAVMATLPLARPDGLAVATGRPEIRHALTSLGLGAGLAVLALGPGTGMIALACAAGAALATVQLARAQIGGYTGDVLGAVEQAGEIVVLLTVVAMT